MLMGASPHVMTFIRSLLVHDADLRPSAEEVKKLAHSSKSAGSQN